MTEELEERIRKLEEHAAFSDEEDVAPEPAPEPEKETGIVAAERKFWGWE